MAQVISEREIDGFRLLAVKPNSVPDDEKRCVILAARNGDRYPILHLPCASDTVARRTILRILGDIEAARGKIDPSVVIMRFSPARA